MPGFVILKYLLRGNGQAVRMGQSVAGSPSVLLLLLEGKQLHADVHGRERGWTHLGMGTGMENSPSTITTTPAQVLCAEKTAISSRITTPTPSLGLN